MEPDRDNKIGLRSEKTRRLLGEIPPSLVRWGYIVIFVILAALVCGMFVLDYPYGSGVPVIRHFVRSLAFGS